MVDKKDTRPELQNIDGMEFYSINEICQNGWFYWLKAEGDNLRGTVRQLIEADTAKGAQSILKAKFRGQGAGRRWYIQGENIINFVADFEATVGELKS